MSVRQRRRREMAGMGRSDSWRSNAEHKAWKKAQRQKAYGYGATNAPGPSVSSLGDALLLALVTSSAPYASAMATSEDRGRRVATQHARASAIGKPVKIRDMPGVVQPFEIRED